MFDDPVPESNDTQLDLIQKLQNQTLRKILRKKWDVGAIEMLDELNLVVSKAKD